MKPLTPTRHGIVDYCACALMLAAPRLLKLSPETQAVSTGLGVSYLGVAAFTDFPPAVRRVLPFPLHGKIELSTLPVLLGLAAWRPGGLRQTSVCISWDWQGWWLVFTP